VADLDDVADDLYGASPDQFVARRDAAAKAARADGDRDLAQQIAALRKPTVAAWLVNALLRDVPDLGEQLVALGDSLREAERSLDGAGLRDLSRQRRALVTSLVGRAKVLGRQAGHKVGEPVAQEVDATLTAALADPEIAREVTSGRLTAGREFAGFGSFAPGSPVEAPRRATTEKAAGPRSTGAPKEKEPTRAPARSRAHLRVVEDADDAEPAEPAAEEAPRESAADRRRRRDREDAVRSAQRAKDEAAAALDRAREHLDDATRDRDEQQEAVATAEQAAADARREVDDLEAALVDLRRRLAAAQKALARADDAESRAGTTLHAQEKALTSAQRDLRQAQHADTDATRALERAEQALADLGTP